MPPTPEQKLDEIFEKVVNPILAAHDTRQPPPEILESALSALDRIGDFEIPARAVMQSPRLLEQHKMFEHLLREGDRLVKRGRTLEFDINGGRNLELSGHSWKGAVEGAFQFEFRLASERFSESHVQSKAQEDLESLRAELQGLPSERVLITAILPQKKKLLGVHTPLGIEVFGLKFPIRFLIAGFSDRRVQVFAVGPTTRQIA